MSRLLMVVVGLVLCTSATAAADKVDPRITYYTYSPDRVFPVHTELGLATIIQFEKDERIQVDGDDSTALGFGDAKAWTVGVRGNGILMKPKADYPSTNILVVTNKRTYAFEVKVTPEGKKPTYIVRFRYPDTEAKTREDRKAEALRAMKEAKQHALLKAKIYSKNSPVFNPNYSWVGTSSKLTSRSVSLLKPTAVWDDGRFTHLMYDNSVSLPNFYKVKSDGTEGLMNFHIDADEPNVVILQEVVRLIRARIGDEVIELVNNGYVAPAFNNTGTGDFDSMRLKKD